MLKHLLTTSELPFYVTVAFCIRDTGGAVIGVSPFKASKDKLRAAVAPDREADKGNISLAFRRPFVRLREGCPRQPALLCSFPQKRRKRDAPRMQGPKRVPVAIAAGEHPKWQKDTSQIQSLHFGP